VQNLKKVIAWRILSTAVSVVIVYLYLGEIQSAGELTIIMMIVMTILHYFFERWWEKDNKHLKKS